jgi:hypothetical protein
MTDIMRQNAHSAKEGNNDVCSSTLLGNFTVISIGILGWLLPYV